MPNNIYTHCTLPEFIKHGEQVVIYTSHGCAIKAGKGNGTEEFDYTLSIGNNVIDAQCRFLQCDKSKVLPLGYPRNDILYRKHSDGSTNPSSTGFNKKVLLWMPTFRKSVQGTLLEQGCEVAAEDVANYVKMNLAEYLEKGIVK